MPYAIRLMPSALCLTREGGGRPSVARSRCSLLPYALRLMPYALCLTGEAEDARGASAGAEGRVRGAQTDPQLDPRSQVPQFTCFTSTKVQILTPEELLDPQTGLQTDAEDAALEEEHAGVAGVAGSCRSCCSFWCPL